MVSSFSPHRDIVFLPPAKKNPPDKARESLYHGVDTTEYKLSGRNSIASVTYAYKDNNNLKVGNNLRVGYRVAVSTLHL